VAIITTGGSYGVICSDHCASNGLNVVKLPEETIAEFDKIFPPRWSRGNPVDPAGDRNLVAFLEATEMILKLDVVDAVIFMGFGGLSSLVSTFLKDFLPKKSETHEEKRQLPGLFDLDSVIPSLGGFLFQGDHGQKEIQRIVTLAIESGEIDAASFYTASGLDLSRVLGLMDTVLANLVRHWMETYKKPVVPITFGDEGVYVKLKRGFYYAYSSPQRAARVLSKLAEYKEYLERC